jgi:hypothetical protein
MHLFHMAAPIMFLVFPYGVQVQQQYAAMQPRNWPGLEEELARLPPGDPEPDVLPANVSGLVQAPGPVDTRQLVANPAEHPQLTESMFKGVFQVLLDHFLQCHKPCIVCRTLPAAGSRAGHGPGRHTGRQGAVRRAH